MPSPPPRDFEEWMRMVERELRRAKTRNNVAILKRIEQVAEDVVEGTQRQPAAPIELVYQTSHYANSAGVVVGRVHVDFPDVVVGQDAEPIEVSHYELWGRDESEYDPDDFEAEPPEWQLLSTSTESRLTFAPLVAGSTWRFRVRAIGRTTAVPGVWSPERVLTIEGDTTPPPIPATPTLNIDHSIFTLTWNGLAASGDPMPADFAYVEVAMGAQTSPGEDDLTDWRLPRGGSAVFSGVPYTENRYFRIRAVDTSGNVSPWSANVSGMSQPFVDADLIHTTIDERIRRGDNLIPYGDGAEGAEEGFFRWEFEYADKPVGTVASFTHTPAVPEVKDTAFGSLTVTPGRGYVFSFWVKADGPGSTMRVEIVADNAVGLTPTDVFNGEVPTEWTKHEVPVEMGPETTGIFFRVHHNTGSTHQVQRTAGWAMQGRVSGVIIEDDSISAASLYIDEALWSRMAHIVHIEADHIDFNTFEGDSGFIGALNSSVITSAVVRSNAGTPRVQLDEFGFHAYTGATTKSFEIDAATGNVTARGATFTASEFRTATASNDGVRLYSGGLAAYNSSGTRTFYVSATTGNVTADGGTFTGATFRSSASGARVEMNDTGYHAYDASGTRTFWVSAATGNVYVYDGTISGVSITGSNITATNTISGSAITGGTITGTTLQTSSSSTSGLKLRSLSGGKGEFIAYQPNGLEGVKIDDNWGRIDMRDRLVVGGSRWLNGSNGPGIALVPYGGDGGQGTSSSSTGIWFNSEASTVSQSAGVYVSGTMNDWTPNHLNIRGHRGGKVVLDGMTDTRLVMGGGLQDRDVDIVSPNGAIIANAALEFRLGNMDVYSGGYAVKTYSSSGVFFLKYDTSATRVKDAIEEVRDVEPILSLQPKSWFDKSVGEALADYYEQQALGVVDEATTRRLMESPPMKRIGGLVAEDVADAGLDLFVHYETNEDTGEQEVTGIAYDRLWTLLIPLVRELWEDYQKRQPRGKNK